MTLMDVADGLSEPSDKLVHLLSVGLEVRRAGDHIGAKHLLMNWLIDSSLPILQELMHTV